MIRNTVTFLLILLAFALVACGGGEETAETGGAAPAGGETEAAQETAVEEAAPEQEAPPTAVPEPVVEPEPTAVPQPTAEPTAEPQPTDAPQASGNGWGESGSTAQSACDHPLFPIRPGYTFVMSGEGEEDMRWEVLSVEGDLDQATAVMQMSSGDLVFDTAWECSAEGGLVSFDFSNPALSAFAPDALMTVTEGSGNFLPAYEELTPGHTWDSSFSSEFSFTQVEEGLELEIEGTIETAQTNEVVNNEPATFDGQEVEAVLVHQNMAMIMAMNLMGSTVNNELEMAGEVQFGYGIGMLQQTSFSEFGDFTSVLKEVYVP